MQFLIIIAISLLGFKPSSFQIHAVHSNQFIATASSDSTIKIWDVNDDCMLMMSLKGHKDEVYDIEFSLDGSLIFSASKDFTIKVWDVRSGTLIKTLNDHKGIVKSLDLSSSGKYLASGSHDKMIRIGSGIDGTFLYSINSEMCINDVKFTDDEKKIIVAGFLPILGQVGAIMVWDLETNLTKNFIKTNSEEYNSEIMSITLLKSSYKEILIASAINGTILKYNIGDELKLEKVIINNFAPFYSTAVSFDGKLFAAGSSVNITFIWSTENWIIQKSLIGHLDYILSVEFLEESNFLLTGSKDGTVKLWDLNSDKLLLTISEGNITIWKAKFFEYKISDKEKRDSIGCLLNTSYGEKLVLHQLFPKQINQCSSLIKNCQICTNEGGRSVCHKCFQGFYLNYDSNCTDCTQDGEYIDNSNPNEDGYGACLKKSNCKLPNCEKCQSLDESCETCQEGFFLQKLQNKNFFICTLCNESGYIIEGKYCKSCLECSEMQPDSSLSNVWMYALIFGVLGVLLILFIILWILRKTKRKNISARNEQKTIKMKRETSFNLKTLDETINLQTMKASKRTDSSYDNITKIKSKSPKNSEIRNKVQLGLNENYLNVAVGKEIDAYYEEMIENYEHLRFPNPKRLEDALENKELIGEGTFAKVYKFKLDEATYAVKIIECRNEEDILATIHEIKIHTKVSCSQVLHLYWILFRRNNIGSLDIYLISDYMNYSLLKLLRENIVLTLKDKINIFKRLLGGLVRFEQFSEDLSLIHCDIKPANILLNIKNNQIDKKQIRYADFGIGFFCKKLESVIASGYTLKYAAPETVASGIATTKSDIYSLGLVASEIFGFDKINQSLNDQSEKNTSNMFEKNLDLFISSLHFENTEKLVYLDVFVLIKKMVNFRPEERPSAFEAKSLLIDFIKKYF